MSLLIVALLEFFQKYLLPLLFLASLFLLVRGLGYLDSKVQKHFVSQKNITKINKNKHLKAFANKHKFLFFRDRWKGYYKGYFTEIKIEYVPIFYHLSLYVKTPLEKYFIAII